MDIDKKSIGIDGKPLITPGQVVDISKRSKEYPTPPCALDATAKQEKRVKFKDLLKKLAS